MTDSLARILPAPAHCLRCGEVTTNCQCPQNTDVVPTTVPPPTNPMAVARVLLAEWDRGGRWTLYRWRGQWMAWEGPCWVEIEDAELRRRAYIALEHAQYLKSVGDDKVKRQPWAPNKRKVSDVLDAQASITHLDAKIDPPSWIGPIQRGRELVISCANGLLNVPERKLTDHDPEFFNLVAVPFDYNAKATAPRWEAFLKQLWPNDPEQIAALQEWFGYVISGNTDQHKILLIVGPSRSGKGTIARILTMLIGAANVAGPTLASLGTNFGLQPLLGKPLGIISDARLGGKDNHQVTERLLTVSGEDTIDVDRKYHKPWTGKLPTRFMILSNELPQFGDASGVIANRFLVLTMTASWLGNENKKLTQELATELPGILNWALVGLDRLKEQGRFTEPTSSVEARTAMQDMASPTSAFVRERCQIGPEHRVVVDDFWQAWKAWCEDAGHRPGNKATLSRNLRSTVPQTRSEKPHGQPREYVGIALAPESKPHNGQSSGSGGSSRSEDRAAGDSSGSDAPEQPPDVISCAGCGEPLRVTDPSQTCHPDDACEAKAGLR